MNEVQLFGTDYDEGDDEPGYCYNCGADHPSECHCCHRCHGSGNVVYTDLEWDYFGPDYGPCPECGGCG